MIGTDQVKAGRNGEFACEDSAEVLRVEPILGTFAARSD
jgi:hypothetical protein